MVDTVTISGNGQSVTMTGRQLRDLNGDDQYPVPSDDTFQQEDAEYLPGFDLEKIGQQLIRECMELAFLSRYDVAYVWKRAGAVSNQKAVLGKCTKASGKLKHFAKVTYVIEVAADHCRDAQLTRRQMEALIYHELSHPIELMDDKGNIKPAIVGHDLEMFWAEYRRYGAWRSALEEAEQVFRQERMDIAAEPAPEPGPTPTERLAGMMALKDDALHLMGARS